MTKRLLLFFITILAAYHVQSATLQYLVVKTNDGDLFSFVFSDAPVITFDKQTMKIESKSKTHSFEISNVKEYSFSENDVTSGLEDVRANELRLINDENGNIIIDGVQPNSIVRLYSINGKEQSGKISSTGERVYINLDSLPKGIYIVSVNNKSFKVYKK